MRKIRERFAIGLTYGWEERIMTLRLKKLLIE